MALDGMHLVEQSNLNHGFSHLFIPEFINRGPPVCTRHHNTTLVLHLFILFVQWIHFSS